MSARNPQVTYTLDDIEAQRRAIAAIDGRVILLAQLLEQCIKGSVHYWEAKANLLEMQTLANDARKDLETMKRSAGL